MSVPKLYYFNLVGRGDIVRLTFIHCDEKFEDIRFKFDEWPKYKDLSPTGQCPFLITADGKVKVHSTAIGREIARRHGLMGLNDEEYYRIERMINQTLDVILQIYQQHFYTSGEENKKAKKEFIESKSSKLLNPVVEFLKENANGFVAGDKLSYGDLCLFTMIDQLRLYCPDINVASKYPTLQQHYDLVLKQSPQIAEYVRTRSAEQV